MKVKKFGSKNNLAILLFVFLSLLLVFSLTFAGFFSPTCASALTRSDFAYYGSNYFELFSNNMSGFGSTTTLPASTNASYLYRNDNNTILYNNKSNDIIELTSPYYFKNSSNNSLFSQLLSFPSDATSINKYNGLAFYLYNAVDLAGLPFNFCFNIATRFPSSNLINPIPQGFEIFIRIYDYYNGQDTLKYTINMDSTTYNNYNTFSGIYEFNNTLGSTDIWFLGIPHITLYSNFDNYTIEFIGLGQGCIPVAPTTLNVGFNKGYSSGLYGFETATNDYTNVIDITTLEKLNAEYSRGYNIGYAEASANSNTFLGLLSSVVEAPLKAFLSIFDFEILGYNMRNFLGSLITISLVLFIIKLVLGNFSSGDK